MYKYRLARCRGAVNINWGEMYNTISGIDRLALGRDRNELANINDMKVFC